MKIICTKQTWCIKATDVHKRFGRIKKSIQNNDADLLQWTIWYTISHAPLNYEAKNKLEKIWHALIYNENTEIL